MAEAWLHGCSQQPRSLAPMRLHSVACKTHFYSGKISHPSCKQFRISGLCSATTEARVWRTEPLDHCPSLHFVGDPFTAVCDFSLTFSPTLPRFIRRYKETASDFTWNGPVPTHGSTSIFEESLVFLICRLFSQNTSLPPTLEPKNSRSAC